MFFQGAWAMVLVNCSRLVACDDISPLIGSDQAYSGKVLFTLILSLHLWPGVIFHISHGLHDVDGWSDLSDVTLTLCGIESWPNWVYHYVFGFYCLWKPPLQEANKKIILHRIMLKWLLDPGSEWMVWMVKPSVAGFLRMCDIIKNVSCAASLKEVEK